MDSSDLFQCLLAAEDERDVERILERAGYPLGNEAAWRPLGDTENNFQTVGNQQSEATGALVEKIINAIDAVLLAECHQRHIDPEGSEAPKSMTDAVQQFFSVRDGRLENLDPKDQTALADNIHVVAVGEKTSPCYLIIDRGEGQTPNDFPDTFLSLKKSNKMRIPFVQGKFNAGGTGVLQFCGEKNFQLIVSRRRPGAPVRKGDASADDWGFTIVQRMRPSGGRRSSVYMYLAPDGAIPRFTAPGIKVLPEKRKSLNPRPYAVDLPYGTCVKLYNFKWKARSIATTEARYELERYLHAPCLPFRLTETREYNANYFSTTIAGVWVSVISGAEDADSSKVERGFPAYAELKLRGIGELPYRIAVFTEEVKGRHVPHGVFFTINGQVHGGLPADFVARALKFDYLKDHLVVSVDCTGMDPTVREDFFMASRDRVRKNDVYDELVERLKEALKDHPGLRELNAARRKKDIEQALADDREATTVLSALLKSDPALSVLFSVGDRLVTSTGPGPAVPFVGRKFPTYFRLAKNPQGGLVKPCPVNRTCRVEFETDAMNDYFKRPDCPGRLSISPPNIIEHASLWNGRFSIAVRPPHDANPGDKIEVALTVEDVETDKRGSPHTSRFTVAAQKEADDHAPSPSGTSNPRSPRNGTKAAPALALPNPIEVRKEDWEKRKPAFTPYTALAVKHDGDGGYDYYLNIDNTFLLTELTRAKEQDRPLVKYWFKWGLVLCAMGMLQEEKRKREQRGCEGQAEDEVADQDGASKTGEDLDRIGQSCDGLARVIVPVVRALYRGPAQTP